MFTNRRWVHGGHKHKTHPSRTLTQKQTSLDSTQKRPVRFAERRSVPHLLHRAEVDVELGAHARLDLLSVIGLLTQELVARESEHLELLAVLRSQLHELRVPASRLAS